MAHDHSPATAASDVEQLDLDGVLLDDFWTDVHDRVRAAAPPQVRRVLDLGAGTGNGAIRFAASYPDAEVVAVDGDPPMLARIAEKAPGRVRTEHLDLDQAFPDLTEVDIAWASLSLHHVGDPDDVLARVRTALRPGGLLAIAEMSEPLRFLTDPAGVQLEQHCLDAARHEFEHELPHLNSDWPARLRAAGFSVLAADEIAIDVAPSRELARYAWLWFDRLRDGFGERLDESERAALDTLLAEDLAGRTGLRAHGTRTLLLARRG